MSEAIAKIERNTLATQIDPEAEVEWASRCAKALVKAINTNPKLKVRIGQGEYLKVEAWQTIGAMAKVDHVETVWCREYTPPGAPEPIGWEARVEVRDRDGNVRGSGEAMCVRTEKTWANRDEFAIRSMAQTRAMGKAFRMALAYVVTLAGFEPTPAEEMSVVEGTTTAPRPKPATPPPTAAPPPPKKWTRMFASTEQVTEMKHLRDALVAVEAMTDADFQRGLLKYYASKDPEELSPEQADELIERLRALLPDPVSEGAESDVEAAASEAQGAAPSGSSQFKIPENVKA